MFLGWKVFYFANDANDAHLVLLLFVNHQARLSNVVEADPDVAAAMDILSFALYHENTKVIGEGDSNDDTALGQKRQREDPEVTDASDVEENDAQKERVEGAGAADASSSLAPPGQDALTDLKAAVYAKVT